MVLVAVAQERAAVALVVGLFGEDEAQFVDIEVGGAGNVADEQVDGTDLGYLEGSGQQDALNVILGGKSGTVVVTAVNVDTVGLGLSDLGPTPTSGAVRASLGSCGSTGPWAWSGQSSRTAQCRSRVRVMWSSGSHT